MSQKQNIITFPAGIPGLSRELTGFSLDSLGENSPFFYLQSLQDEHTGFILVNPFDLFADYEFDLPDEVARTMDLNSPEQAAVFCIVNASGGLKKATVNLLAPVVLNTASGTARQVVLNDKRYGIRHPLPGVKAGGTREG